MSGDIGGHPVPVPVTQEAHAKELHRLFMAYVNAGFTREEALELIQQLIATQVAPLMEAFGDAIRGT